MWFLTGNEGHCHVGIEDKGDLGVWVSHKRYLQRRGELPPEEETALVKLGVVFDVYLASFLTRFYLLKMFVDMYGPTAEPPRRVGDANFHFLKLWSFLWTQRDQYKRDRLGSVRKEMLLGLGIRLEQQKDDGDDDDFVGDNRWEEDGPDERQRQRQWAEELRIL